MPDPVEVMAALDAAASELDQLSRDLAGVERALEPLAEWYDLMLEGTAAQLWDQYTTGEISRLPGEDVRKALAHRALREDQERAAQLARYGKLSASRKRLQRRIEDIKSATSANQSILSALKIEMEATRR